MIIICRFCGNQIPLTKGSQQLGNNPLDDYGVCMNCRQFKIAYYVIYRNGIRYKEDIKYNISNLQFDYTSNETSFRNLLKANPPLFPFQTIFSIINYTDLINKIELYNYAYDLPPASISSIKNQQTLEIELNRIKNLGAFL